jgi:hypothetical protein
MNFDACTSRGFCPHQNRLAGPDGILGRHTLEYLGIDPAEDGLTECHASNALGFGEESVA